MAQDVYLRRPKTDYSTTFLKKFFAMKKSLLILLSLLAPFATRAEVTDAPSVEIDGENYTIQTVAVGAVAFTNRTTMTIQDSSDIDGWQFARINANSTYIPGPLISASIKAADNGYFYCLVEDVASPDPVTAWATAEGWSKVEGFALAYGTGTNQTWHLYRKPCTKDEWVAFAQPNTFSGATLVAPSLKAGARETEKGVAVSIRTKGWMEADTLAAGVTAFGNRTFVWKNVKREGWHVTRYNGGAAPASLEITALESGYLFIGYYTADTSFNPAAEGWTRESALDWSYSDGASTTFQTYKKLVTKGDVVKIQSTAWTGVPVISSSPIAYCCLPATLDAPSVTVSGRNISVASVSKGSVAFLNRTVALLDIEEDFAGWQFVSVIANAFSGGAYEKPVVNVTPAANGYLYVMVENKEKPAVVDSWAAAEGWTLVDGYQLSYGTGDLQKLHVYRKPCTKDVTVTLTMPSVFSGALLTAPAIAIRHDAQPVAVAVSSSVAMQTVQVSFTTTIFADRGFCYRDLPSEVVGRYATRINGQGSIRAFEITALETGWMYVGQYSGSTEDLTADGWVRAADMDWRYSDGGFSPYYAYKKSVTKGDLVHLATNTAEWGGYVILSASPITLVASPLAAAITSAGWGTACVPFDATISAESGKEATAYYVSVTDGTLTKSEVTGVIPGGTAVLLKGDEGTVTFTRATASADDKAAAAEGMLMGTLLPDGNDFTQTGYTYYILGVGGDGIGFYFDGVNHDGEEGAGASCGQYHAVLAVPASAGAGAVRCYPLNGATGIDTAGSDNRNDVCYDLSGRVVSTPAAHGIYITGGRKVVR